MAEIPNNLDPALFQSCFSVNGKGGSDQKPSKPPKNPAKKHPRPPRKTACDRCNIQHRTCIPTDPANTISTCTRCARAGFDCRYCIGKSKRLSHASRQQLIQLLEDTESRLAQPNFPLIPADQQAFLLEQIPTSHYPAWVMQASMMSPQERLALRQVLTNQMMALTQGEMNANATAAADASTAVATTAFASTAFTYTAFASTASATTAGHADGDGEAMIEE